jgi:DNA-binding MarR family transcriptional regulator
VRPPRAAGSRRSRCGRRRRSRGHGPGPVLDDGSVAARDPAHRRPSCRVQDVAAALGITVGAVSKLVDRLEAADLCVRRAHPDDRRSSLLDATDAGREAAAAADVAVRDELAQRLDSLSVRDLDRVATLLGSIRATVG